ncbi:MAG: hypothetical protein ASARMPREDX12_003641 [Alectoria sarmentosa]|nr:MAG: hypothetical protein ASARMPREDX12_003641 [Alectoria sarmentosa]
MSSSGRGCGYRSHASGTYDPRSNGYRTGSYNRGSIDGNRNPGLVPAYADTTSARRSMNIEDMLNPSDERQHQQPQSRLDLTLTEPTHLLLEEAPVLHQHRDKEAGAQDRRMSRHGLAPFDLPIPMKKSTSSGIFVSTVGIPGLPSPRLSTLASLRMEKGDARSPDSSANFIELQRKTACRM